ncbi:sugar kinase, ribokinase [Rhizobium leguminosarum bv. trifolii WSM2297]|uniref:Ribokinase n=1 Tax=Rhizobium leguminosarum bv. trifolii WSM2297 TaxID=754762 RepID=J0WF16_RHILT|nr:ribokinase [Rhizobium leguminosarum]EJC83888.1 sugar kinase, ribokinase [Rhizobium leguminosarum bv. trifolii WSM2297]EJC84521.1 sugar kinase, ribokinase [Rhizobium leguminosarum bv. trifolii WSM2297]
MRAYIVGNIAIDETIAVSDLPVIGASILGNPGGSDLGGKGTNQAVVMARCGVPTTLVAPVGRDVRADAIRRCLAEEPLQSELIEIEDASSDVSIIFRLPRGENAIVTTTESAQSLCLSQVRRILSTAGPGDLMMLQGNLSDRTTRDILEHARAIGMVTAFNPSPVRSYFSDLWALIDIAFLNKGEAQTLTGTTGRDAAEYLLSRGLREVVLTLGGDGAMLVNQRDSIEVPARACHVVDTTGAGDTFMAVALASCALRGQRLDRPAIEHAAAAAAITVSRHGTTKAFPTILELEAILK